MAVTLKPEDFKDSTLEELTQAFVDEQILAEVEKREMQVSLTLNEDNTIEIPQKLAVTILDMLQHISRKEQITVESPTSLFTTQQVADLLSLSRPTIVKMIDSGELPAIKVGTHRRVTAEAIRDLRLKRHEEFLQRMREIAQTEDPRLTEFNPLIKNR